MDVWNTTLDVPKNLTSTELQTCTLISDYCYKINKKFKK